MNSPSRAAPAPLAPRPWRWLAGAILLGVALRAWLHFRSPLVPGINGAYYLIQARALIEKGTLGIPDLPLTFYLHATVARVFAWISTAPIESAIVISVKVLDSVLPPLAAVPVFFLVRKWSAACARGTLAAGAAALAVGAGAPALFMVGDFQKNSLGLVWFAGLLWSLRAWLDDHTPRRAALVLLLLGLVGLTHVGVFGTAALAAGLVVGMHFARRRDGSVLRALPWVLAAALVIGAVGALVAWKFDPVRVQKLVTSFTQPVHYLSGSDPRMPAGGPPGGGPPGAMGALPVVLFSLVVVSGLVLAWRRRDFLPAADTTLVAGLALTLLLLTGPWVRGDKIMRFYLNAMIPAVLVGSFVLIQLPWRRTRVVIGAVAILLLVGSGVPMLSRGGRQIVAAESIPELRSLATMIPHPERTLIVAMHGVEWWAAWTLHTRIAHADALRPEDWQRYDVLFLDGKMKMPFPMPDRSGPPGGPGHRPGGVPPGPLGRPVIPPDAEILHRGDHWTLARVTHPVPAPPRPFP
ncbi:MAG: hypothetical protein WCF18_22025 [Chthoniobacteraceae bacterium]